jgi:hypothetical protein
LGGVNHDTRTLQSMCAATRKRRVLGYIAAPLFFAIVAVKARSSSLLACSIVFISCGEAGMTALGRVGLPDDIGAMIASVLSEDNRPGLGQTM